MTGWMVTSAKFSGCRRMWSRLRRTSAETCRPNEGPSGRAGTTKVPVGEEVPDDDDDDDGGDGVDGSAGVLMPGAPLCLFRRRHCPGRGRRGRVLLGAP